MVSTRMSLLKEADLLQRRDLELNADESDEEADRQEREEKANARKRKRDEKAASADGQCLWMLSMLV